MVAVRFGPLLGLLFVGSCGNAAGWDPRIRSDLVDYYTIVFAREDRDNDGKLSPAEQERLVEWQLAHWPQDGVPPDAEYLRSHLLVELSDADHDQDGQVTLAEYLAPIVREFDCGDRDRNEFLDDAEFMTPGCAESRPIVMPPKANR